MKLEYLKTQLKLTGTSGIGSVFFEAPDVVSLDREKDYPYLIFDVKSIKSVLSWQNQSQESEQMTIKVYILGLYDRRAQMQVQTIEEKWDDLRAYFRTYLEVLNANAYVKINNLNDMPNELFDIGIALDSEVGVSFDLDLTLYCNA